MIPTITTARLTLRPPRPEDADDIYRNISDWDVVRMIARPPWPYPRQLADEFVQTAKSHMIERNGEVIGAIGIGKSDQGYSLGYWLGKAHWGQGLMSEAAVALVDRFFRDTGEQELHSGYLLDNPPSWRVQEKLGFVPVKQRLIHFNARGAEQPVMETLLTHEAFEARRP